MDFAGALPYFPRALLPKGRAVASIGPLPTGAVPA